MKDNSFTDVSDPDALNQAAREIDGKLIQERIDYWMNLFFKFDKGKYATRSKHLHHDWYLTQVEERKLLDPDRDHHQQPQIAGASKTCPLFTGMPVDRPWMQ